MLNNHNWSTGMVPGLPSPDYTHPASVPICHIRASPDIEQRFPRSPRCELSWCEQSIISLHMASDSDLSDSSATSSACNANDNNVPTDGTVMTTQGKRAVDELDWELAAVQKLVRKEWARKQRGKADTNRSVSNLPLWTADDTSTPPLPSLYGTASRRRVPRTLMVPAPIDRRNRTPSAQRSNRLTTTSSPPLPSSKTSPSINASVSASALSAFMRDAESDFDNVL